MTKYNLLIPMAGKGQRFVDSGYTIPKQLIICGNKSLLEWSMDSIDYKDCNLIFVVREDACFDFNIDKIIIEKYKEKYNSGELNIIKIRDLTQGSVESCLAAKKLIDNNLPLFVYCLDVNFSPILDPGELCDKNCILTFKSNSPNYSYVETKDELVVYTQEKKVISNDACVGVYSFEKGSVFVEKAEYMISKNLKTNGEFFITPLYNILIKDGFDVYHKSVDKINIFGTPTEFNFFKNNVLKRSLEKPFVLCSDHSGFDQKNNIKKELEKIGKKYIDVGCYTPDNCDYNDFVRQAVNLIEDKECDIGFGFCRSGQGINIAVNKFKGIKSALINDCYSAEFAVRHNAANFFCIPEKCLDSLEDILFKILNNSFDGGRHQTRVQKTEDIENGSL